MGRRKLESLNRFVDPEVVDQVLKDVRKELIKDPSIILELNSHLNEKRGRELLTALLDLHPTRRIHPIYH